MFLFLDDERNPSQVNWIDIPLTQYVIVRNYNSFCNAIINYFNESGKLPEFITFDHDLSDFDAANSSNPDIKPREKTGFDCAKWLVEFCIQNNLRMCEYQVHSMNPIGRENIISYIESFKRST